MDTSDFEGTIVLEQLAAVDVGVCPHLRVKIAERRSSTVGIKSLRTWP